MFASYARNFAALILVAFVAVILFCTWGVSAMSMDKPMSDYMSQQGEMALCGVSPQGHALVWQNFLHVTPQKVFEILLAALLLVVSFFLGRTWLHAPPLVVQHLRTRIRQSLFIIDPIRRAFSRGIIQPQIYEIAIG